MTEKLYYRDIYKMEFEARILEVDKDRETGHWRVILDHTYFFPEGGGQPADKGWINGILVLDVQKKQGPGQETAPAGEAGAENNDDGPGDSEGDVIYHLLAEYPGGKDTEVLGKIDSDRRLDYMQQHTGQHIISAALWHTGPYKTLSVHMGTELTTIEIDAPEIPAVDIEAVEDLANQVVSDDLPIQFLQVDHHELEKYHLRRPTTRQGKIRLVRIGEFDCAACGGLHFDSTRHVGPIKAAGSEKIRGHARLSWKIGRRAFADYRKKHRIIMELSPILAAKEEDLVQKTRDIQEEIVLLKRKRNLLENRLAQELAQVFYAQTPASPYRVIAVALQEEDDVLVKKILKELIEKAGVLVCLVDVFPDKVQWSMGCSTDTAAYFDFNKIREECLPLIDGKGGGRFPLWQGTGSQPGKAREFLEAFRLLATNRHST